MQTFRRACLGKRGSPGFRTVGFIEVHGSLHRLWGRGLKRVTHERHTWPIATTTMQAAFFRILLPRLHQKWRQSGLQSLG